MKHAPVGARDFHTLGHLQDAGIPSYFSGCLTLTLHRPEVAREQDLIVLNDVPIQVEELIRSCSPKRIEKVSQITAQRDRTKRFQAACDLLEKYAMASLVVTSRLHCALPCLAFGTPVILIASAADETRFPGLDELVTQYSLSEFCANFERSMIDHVRCGSIKYTLIRDTLVQKVLTFIKDDFYHEFDGDYRRLISRNTFGDVRTDMRSAILSALYRQILGREADNDGFSYYLQIIQSSGIDAGIDFVLSDMLASQESKWQRKNI
jgi:hypothetical protein